MQNEIRNMKNGFLKKCIVGLFIFHIPYSIFHTSGVYV